MINLTLDRRSCLFLNKPEKYDAENRFRAEPLKRQFATVKEILKRFQKGAGVLLSDDVGLGKTAIAALVAWIVVLQKDKNGRFCNNVRVYVPNKVLRRRWAEELEYHASVLSRLGAKTSAIKQGKIKKLVKGSIQIVTHYELIQGYRRKESLSCDLMIIDEAHKAKGEGSDFNVAISHLGGNSKRKLILTATPFSIGMNELEQLLAFVGGEELDSISAYSKALNSLYACQEYSSIDVDVACENLVTKARAAIKQMQPYVIRHSVDDLREEESKYFGTVSKRPWNIEVEPANDEQLKLLLRMDRIKKLSAVINITNDKRRNDPRFHVGWDFLRNELECIRSGIESDGAHAEKQFLEFHLDAALGFFIKNKERLHPKVEAVVNASQEVINRGEKVLVFCHHYATAEEVLKGFEKKLKLRKPSDVKLPPKQIWRAAWEGVFKSYDQDLELVKVFVDWLCSAGICSQITSWLGKPEKTAIKLQEQFNRVRVRTGVNGLPTIKDAACALLKSLLLSQSKSTRSVLKNMARSNDGAGFEKESSDPRESHFPGKLDEGYRVMGFWAPKKECSNSVLETLYTAKEPDMVIEIFNSPFGPDVLVITDRLSEGVDLHCYCRHLIHYELDPSPVRTIQRNGRIRRIGSWASKVKKPIMYAYPAFAGTRDEKAVAIMQQRIDAFGVLLGGVPPLKQNIDELNDSFAEAVLKNVRNKLVEENIKFSIV